MSTKKKQTERPPISTPPKPPVEPKPKYPIVTPPKPPVDNEPDPFDNKQVKSWTFSIGIYPGILFGIRTYEEVDFKTHVLYLPFIDFALEIDN